MEMCLLKYRERLGITVRSDPAGVYSFFESGKLIGVWLESPEAASRYLCTLQTVDSVCFGFRLSDVLLDLFVRNAVAKFVSFPGTPYDAASMQGWETISDKIWNSCPSVQICTNPGYGATSMYLKSRSEELVVSFCDLRFFPSPPQRCVTAVIRDVNDVESLTNLNEMTALESLYVRIGTDIVNRRDVVRRIADSLPALAHLTVACCDCLSDTPFGCEDLLRGLSLKHLEIQFSVLTSGSRLRGWREGRGFGIRVRADQLPHCSSLVISGAALTAGELAQNNYRVLHLEECAIAGNEVGPGADRLILYDCSGEKLLSGGLLNRSRRIEINPPRPEDISAGTADSFFFLPLPVISSEEFPRDIKLDAPKLRTLGLCQEALLSVVSLSRPTAIQPSSATFRIHKAAPWRFHLVEDRPPVNQSTPVVLEGLTETPVDFDFVPLLSE